MGRGTSSSTPTQAPSPRASESIAPAISLAARRHPEENQDTVLVRASEGLACVFDGIGGAAGGAEASRAAAAAVEVELATLPPITDLMMRREWLRNAMVRAGVAVRSVRTSSSQGTTAVIAVQAEGFLLWASAGDSRAYRLSAEGELDLLSRDDDSWPRDQLHDEARREVDEAESAEDLGLLATRMFDSRNQLRNEVGMVRRADEVAIDGASLRAGDMVIVCSDGVHDNLSATDMAELAIEHRRFGPRAVAAALAGAAHERGGTDHFRAKDDDTSCVCLEID